jgi:pyrrolidone-carboxylate peptidase
MLRFLIVIIGIALPGSAFALKRTIVLTAFEPLHGQRINNSQVVATGVQELLRSNPNVDLKVCILPVVYDVASQVAIRCMNQLPKPPDLVISLGEGPWAIKLETVTFNYDNDQMQDNRGQVRLRHIIDSSGPEAMRATLPLAKMHCAASPYVPTESSWVSFKYVCNNTGYLLSRFFATQRIPFGFVHVNHSGFNGSIDAVIQAMDAMINAAVRELDRGRGYLEQPATVQEVDLFLKREGVHLSRCEQDYYETLKRSYIQ